MSSDVQNLTPGDVVRQEMAAKGWTQSDLAFVLGTTTATVNQILSNKRNISRNMARAFGAAFDRPPEYFARVQAEWDVRQAASPAPEVATRSRILSRYPLREMAKRGWIDPAHRQGSVEDQVCRFFGADSLDDVPHLAYAAKKTDYEDLPPVQLAWLFRVRSIASEMLVPPYSADKLANVISVFADLRSEADAVRYVPRLLGEAGVRFVVVESLPGSKIDGVCLWLNATSPVIGMSFRFDRIDNFWFVLRHECAHVLHEHGKIAAVVDTEMEKSAEAMSHDEQIANAEASDFCAASDKLESFYRRKHPLFSDRDVVAFAKKIRTHPGLVVGQLQRRMDQYDFLRQHLVKVRKHVASSMMMDGWGDVVPVYT